MVCAQHWPTAAVVGLNLLQARPYAHCNENRPLYLLKASRETANLLSPAGGDEW